MKVVGVKRRRGCLSDSRFGGRGFISLMKYSVMIGWVDSNALCCPS